MTLECKKKFKCNKMADLKKKKIKILLKNLMVFGLAELYFSSNHKTGRLLYGKTSTQ